MSTNGGALKGLRATNRRDIVQLLLNEGPLHRAELARRMKTSRTTISNITNELLEQEIALSISPDQRSTGHSRELVAINPHAGYSLGVDFTLNQVAINVSDLTGNTVAETCFAVGATDDAESRVAAAAIQVRTLLTEAGIADERVVGIGVGVPGQINRRTFTVGGSIPGQVWSLVDVRETLSKHLPFEVFVENNSRFEGFAEKRWGAGKDSDNMLYVSFSSGVGLALFDGGHIYRGSIGAAGEVGHMSTDINGPVCPCGNRGCLVLQTGTARILSLLQSVLGENATWADLLRETAAGNSACLSVMSEIGAMVGRFLAGISNLLDPELVVIGGELSQTGDAFMVPLTAALHEHVLPLTGSHVRVAQAFLEPGAATGARGGAALALQEMVDTSTIDRLGSI